MSAYAEAHDISSATDMLRWHGFISSEPHRVVELLGLSDNDVPMTDSGDTAADVVPALKALMNFTADLRDPSRAQDWPGLVDAGLSDALCVLIADRSKFGSQVKVSILTRSCVITMLTG